MGQGLVIFGVGLSVVALAVILWSITFPSRRIWPPGQSGPIVLIFVWLPTLALFAVLITLGVLDWGEIALPMWLRFGVGPSLIAVGNLAVWHEVRKFGLVQTSGAKGSLRTDVSLPVFPASSICRGRLDRYRLAGAVRFGRRYSGWS